MTVEYHHVAVLKEEVLSALGVEPDDCVVDVTLGGGDHGLALVQRLGSGGHFIGIDQDDAALSAAKKRFQEAGFLGNSASSQANSRAIHGSSASDEGNSHAIHGSSASDEGNSHAIHGSSASDEGSTPAGPQITFVHGNFSELDRILLEQNIPGINRILFDLGVSSFQFDEGSRGFSYREDAPLDMRMNPRKQTLNAAEVINTYNTTDLTRILTKYGDEKFAPRIATEIAKRRAEAPIKTTFELSELVKSAYPAFARTKKHPAKKTFQAIRIEVNQELKALQEGLDAAIRWLLPGGRIAVISYHSKEDRIVKRTFNELSKGCICPPDLPVCVCNNVEIVDVKTKHAILPRAGEVFENPRARSAKLRVAEKL